MDVDADAEFARKLAAELQASEEMAERQRMEQDAIMAEQLRKEEEEELARKVAHRNAATITETDMDDSLQVLGTVGGEGNDSVDLNGAAGTRRDRNGLENSIKDATRKASGRSDGASRLDAATLSAGRALDTRGAGNSGHKTSGSSRSSSSSRGGGGNRKRPASPTSSSRKENDGESGNTRSNSCPDAAAGLSRTDATRRRRKLTKNAGSSVLEDERSTPGSPWQ